MLVLSFTPFGGIKPPVPNRTPAGRALVRDPVADGAIWHEQPAKEESCLA